MEDEHENKLATLPGLSKLNRQYFINQAAEVPILS